MIGAYIGNGIGLPLMGGQEDISAVFAGTGSLTVSAVQIMLAFATFAGTGRLCVDVLRRLGPPGATTNVSVTGPGPTNNVVV